MPTARFPTITPEALESLRSRIGKAVPRIDDWGNLDLRYDV